VKYKVASTDDARTEFIDSGRLSDSVDTQYRSINERTPVFAFSHHVGNVARPNSSQEYISNIPFLIPSVLFTIGYVQDPIVKYASPSGMKEYLPLWKSYFPTTLEMIYFHYQDYAHCVNVSAQLDSQIERDAYKVSRNVKYDAIVALSARQAIGGIVFAESAHERIADGKGSRPLVFLKEISSDGNMQTVDVIFPAYRSLSTTLTEVCQSTCTLNLRFWDSFLNHYSGTKKQDCIRTSTVFMISDHRSPMRLATPMVSLVQVCLRLGNDEYMPVEECGNMIFMTLAYSQFTDNINYLEKHYKILKQWTSYLIDFGLIPATQGKVFTI